MKNKIKKNKILKISGISGHNTGDWIISEIIQSLFKNTDYSIDSYHITNRKKNEPLKKLINAIWMASYSETREKLFTKKKLKKFIYIKLNFIVYYFNIVYVYFLDYPKFKKLSKKYSSLIIGGGNLLFNKSGNYYLFTSVLLSKLFAKKNLIFYAVGVGPFSYPYKNQLKIIQKHSNLILVRDTISLEYFPSSKNVIKTFDPAILISDFDPLPENRIKQYLGVNLMDFKYFNKFENQDVKKTSDNIIRIAKKFNLKILLLTSSIADLSFTKMVFDYIEQYDKNLIEHQYMFPENNISEYYQDISICIGHRMHPSLFALSYEIPYLVFPWQDKIESYIEDIFGKEEKDNILLLDINFNSKEVIEKLEKILEKDYGNILYEVKKKIYDDFTLVVNILKKEEKL